jgi:hypothetical protein
MGRNSTAAWILFALSVTGMIISLITPGHDEVDEWLMDVEVRSPLSAWP